MKLKSPILITGATGFLGSYLTKALVDRYDNVVILKRSQSSLRRLDGVVPRIKAFYDVDNDGVKKAFQDFDIKTVIHCATDYGRQSHDVLKMINSNLTLPLSILQEGKAKKLKYFINLDTILDKAVNDYSLSKKQFRDWLQQDAPELVRVNVAIEHFYGPSDDKSKFVSWIIDQFLNQKKELSLTAGEQKRDFVFYTDVLEALLTILNWTQKAESGYYHFEIGTGITTSIKELVLIISKLCGNSTTEILFGKIPYRKNEVMDAKVDLQPISKLGWQSKVELLNGLRQTIEFEMRNSLEEKIAP